ncbi:MAG TPA: hypothetical protein VK636_09735 [Gemmatimonadaceae bacterium]|nr:hypothetical protein [Gemmatimonadaceae bacterium]
MNDFSVRRRLYTLAAFGTVVALAACEDKRTKELTNGITRDSVMSVLSQKIIGGGRDSFPNVYEKDSYLIGGQRYEVLYFSPNNQKKGKDTVAFKNLTPLVFVDNKLIAKGWPAWDSIGSANKIVVPDHK